jgi:hypothetical protein
VDTTLTSVGMTDPPVGVGADCNFVDGCRAEGDGR